MRHTAIACEDEVVRFHSPEGAEGDHAEGDDQERIDQLDLAVQMIRTGGGLSAARPTIDPTVFRARL